MQDHSEQRRYGFAPTLIVYLSIIFRVSGWADTADADALTHTNEFVPVANGVYANLWTQWDERENMVQIVTFIRDPNDVRNRTEYWIWCDTHHIKARYDRGFSTPIESGSVFQKLEEIACASPKYRHLDEAKAANHHWVRLTGKLYSDQPYSVWGAGLWVDDRSIKEKNEQFVSVLVRTSNNYEPGLFFVDCKNHLGISESDWSTGGQAATWSLNQPATKELEAIACGHAR
jgi:hypothetical protein